MLHHIFLRKISRVLVARFSHQKQEAGEEQGGPGVRNSCAARVVCATCVPVIQGFFRGVGLLALSGIRVI